MAKTGNYGYLPNFPAYVAYTTTETRDGRTSIMTRSITAGWMGRTCNP